jgi:non-lysosomal glucosylceramidase
MLGQWFADVMGLDLGLKKERIQKSLHSIYRHNFKHDFWQHPNTQRIYAVNDEKGLLICSWPNGGRPVLPLVYGDEVWTGIEYQVAAHLIYQGLLEEGLALVKAISDRYDGVRRNPWNQIEWGNHYTRAMASYSVVLALSGFHYSAVERSITFHPKMKAENFQSFFAAGSGWGLYSQKRQGGAITARIECRHGNLTLKRVILANASKAVVTGPDGSAVACTVKNGSEIEFANEVVIAEGKSAIIVLS